MTTDRDIADRPRPGGAAGRAADRAADRAATADPERTTVLLSMLLGDYWFAEPGYIPSAALAAVLGEFGVTPEATRTALSRLTRRGRLEGTRSGRHTAYRLAPAVRAQAVHLGRRLMAFGTTPVDWDGTWTCVALPAPESRRRGRPALGTRLRELGFGAVLDGTWLRPGAPDGALETALKELLGSDALVLSVTEVPGFSGVDVTGAWDLEAVRNRYDTFLAELEALAPRLDAGDVGSTEALRVRSRVMLGWRSLAMQDPRLPDALLPQDWPLHRARERFVAVYDTLGPLAQARVHQLVAEHPGTPPPRHHRAADSLSPARPSPTRAVG